jgi:hypothetical protein
MKTALVAVAAALVVAGVGGCETRHTEIADQDSGGPDAGTPDGGSPDAGDGGAACTPSSQLTNYPVKVLLIVEQGGEMCVLDPPGAQAGNPGFCTAALAGDAGNLPAVPGRIRAMQALLTGLQALPNVEVAVLPFETNPQQPWPTTWETDGLFHTADGTTTFYLSAFQNQLGNADDFQGVLKAAQQALAVDVQAQALRDPVALSRTRYAVVLLSSGIPYPRCAADDVCPDAGCATPTQPDGIWPDSVPSFCNGLPDGGSGCSGTQCVAGFVPGTDRNQNAQLLALVDAMKGLQATYGVGDISFHTRLLLDAAEVQTCGAICQDLFGAGVTASSARVEGNWLLTQMAVHGSGTFGDPGNPGTLTLSDIDLSPLTTFCGP